MLIVKAEHKQLRKGKKNDEMWRMSAFNSELILDNVNTSSFCLITDAWWKRCVRTTGSNILLLIDIF